MAKVSVYNMAGKQVDEIELNDAIFGVEVKNSVMHRSVVTQLANSRQGTQSAQTRGEVRGGGRKPWKQKGTGRARAGTLRAPNFVGGGVVFAPKPRDYSKKLNRKENRAALRSALSEKVSDEKLIVLDQLTFSDIKTKSMLEVLENLNVKKVLIIINDNDKNVILSARNIPGVQMSLTNTINVYDILKYDKLIVTKDAVATIEEVYV
jgi:large subunit ribosomal protein L4